MIGLTSAWRLAQAGLGVRLFERGQPGAEASSAALGVLLAGGSAGSRLENAWAALTQASLDLYPAVAAQLHDQTGVDVELRDEGVLDIALDSRELALLQEELASQQAAGTLVTFLTSQSAGKTKMNRKDAKDARKIGKKCSGQRHENRRKNRLKPRLQSGQHHFDHYKF